jgi:hypothetical protein
MKKLTNSILFAAFAILAVAGIVILVVMRSMIVVS